MPGPSSPAPTATSGSPCPGTLGRITPGGQITEVALDGTAGRPILTAGPDKGNLVRPEHHGRRRLRRAGRGGRGPEDHRGVRPARRGGWPRTPPGRRTVSTRGQVTQYDLSPASTPKPWWPQGTVASSSPSTCLALRVESGASTSPVSRQRPAPRRGAGSPRRPPAPCRWPRTRRGPRRSRSGRWTSGGCGRRPGPRR